MLNPSQQAVVDFRDGACLVIAGAGTGKTRVLVHRAAALIEEGLPPNRLLLITFTRRAAEELKTRVAVLTGNARLPWCGTFHAVGAKLLRLYGEAVGVPRSFSVLDQSDSTELFGVLLRERFTKEQRREFPSKSVLNSISSYQTNTRQELSSVLDERWSKWADKETDIAEIIEEYTRRKRDSNAVDYDDLLLKWKELWERDPRVVPPLFDRIMVDEYQDTNRLQAALLEELKKDTGEVLVVGDDAQAIYGFRGATVRNIFEFGDMFERVTPLRLEHNYRSTTGVLDIANALMEEAEEGFEKHLDSHRGAGEAPQLTPCATDWEEAERILRSVQELSALHDVPLSEQAVLIRSSFHSFRLEMLLTRNEVPYRKVGGLRFADSAHIKDVVAYLRCADNPRDESAWSRVLQHLPGVGPATATKRFRAIMGANSVHEGIDDLALPKQVDKELADRFRSLFAVLLSPEPGPPMEQLHRINEFYKKRMPDFYDNWEERLRDLPVLEEMAGRYESRRGFLDDIVVGDDSVVRSRQHDEDPNKLTVSTIHSAKGCEWAAVHIPHLIEGGLPLIAGNEEGIEQLEEERRLLYVAMTRAKDHLRLYYPQLRMARGREGGMNSCVPSRFLTQRVVAHCRGFEALLDELDDDPDSSAPDGELVYEPMP